MKIVADENIPLLTRFFGDLGDIVKLPGREIKAEHLSDADFLIVRSVTKVNRELLENSSVKFVGTCTIGIDHIDTDYLDQQGIRYCNAPGCNANSVVEYVLSCLSILTETHSLDLGSVTVGIVGYGNVGSLLAARLEKLGIKFKACDPFLDDDSLVSFEEVMRCDLISLHVPLSKEGTHPTYHMIDKQVLESLQPEQILINSSRGPVIDNDDLNDFLDHQPQFTAILDVWEREPELNVELARKVFIGTPHIAGYSFDGKVLGTEMVYRALCQFLGLPSRHSSGQFLEEPPLSKMAFTSNADVDWSIHTAIRACFDVRHDHSLLQASLRLPDEERWQAFDRFRKNYRCRREFSGVKIQLKKVNSELLSKFKSLGFNVKS
ncbi:MULTISPECIES: 4-phosphoerythronate dehydrogenase PdxB [unclassified Oleiphilus]|jgi:erythronate-4-phosphate dehydrogenase|uniref:4-phosphoerythronate dehydrogenase PdxB n=3 Tax=Oleiphilus TaxID=141450 RepID=UPI0007C34375|nr:MULTISPECIES: 4-phosphoerythronate dehydrogenase PdxB [unclassified Oleiphilus]KZY51137.1 erythronate-4-phosphate dehydrogenase [Oleiphilus sp. HI0050]KZY77499.1 erythronate-4-phosphate dehydrogenase [Oleiphilus sp. HI0069]KZY77963.1 erythronate-4-phosphate dehydrogenase [Oleiphilus sp. HI0068]KZZ06925.1 erythronate-4-phosphate dehydrogenase [Oleiphilus sp. HI0078]KZZ19409.1 erythronate-4-phosphate dehydrogenase [Oleiphilus sp. HI0081]